MVCLFVKNHVKFKKYLLNQDPRVTNVTDGTRQIVSVVTCIIFSNIFFLRFVCRTTMPKKEKLRNHFFAEPAGVYSVKSDKSSSSENV